MVATPVHIAFLSDINMPYAHPSSLRPFVLFPRIVMFVWLLLVILRLSRFPSHFFARFFRNSFSFFSPLLAQVFARFFASGSLSSFEYEAPASFGC